MFNGLEKIPEHQLLGYVLFVASCVIPGTTLLYLLNDAAFSLGTVQFLFLSVAYSLPFALVSLVLAIYLDSNQYGLTVLLTGFLGLGLFFTAVFLVFDQPIFWVPSYKITFATYVGVAIILGLTKKFSPNFLMSKE